MASVYVVTSGEYSAYQIEAVFSTPEKAQEFIDAHLSECRSYAKIIEEWPLDRWQDVRDHTYWSVKLWDDGYAEAWSYGASMDGNDLAILHHAHASPPCWLVMNVDASDEAHAVKIAAEQLAMEKARTAGVG